MVKQEARGGGQRIRQTLPVADIDELLTGGRLNSHSWGVIITKYAAMLSTSAAEHRGGAGALPLHSRVPPEQPAATRGAPRAMPEVPSQGQPYRASAIFLDGGADTFNLLGIDGCTGAEGNDLDSVVGSAWHKRDSVAPSISCRRRHPAVQRVRHPPSMPSLQADQRWRRRFHRKRWPLVQPVTKRALANGHRGRQPVLAQHATADPTECTCAGFLYREVCDRAQARSAR